LKKDSTGNFWLKTDHEYYYQTQQHILQWKESTVTLLCALLMGVVQPDFLTSELHLTQNTGILLCPSSPNFGELVFCLKCLVNGTPGSNSCLMSKVTNSQKQAALKFCYCRKKTDEQSVLCCNPKCPIVSFH